MGHLSAGLIPGRDRAAVALALLAAILAGGCGSGGANTTTVTVSGAGGAGTQARPAAAGGSPAANGSHVAAGSQAAGGSTATSHTGSGSGSTATGSTTGSTAGGGSRYSGSRSAGGSRSTSSAHRSQTSTTASAGGSYVNGEVHTPPGAMTLSSPAFALNGPIPAQYTCDGADTSPPLTWRNLPAHTAELVLFIIDDSSIGREGGIRWVVAGLEPTLTGLAAGSLPPGAIVGLNGAGKATYGGICPPKGRTATIELVLWALSQKIPLSSGFIPAIAEHEYSTHELASAVTYAAYTR
jgi:Raf kinase inhibitor-like YbhB/YbcL family protein